MAIIMVGGLEGASIVLDILAGVPPLSDSAVTSGGGIGSRLGVGTWRRIRVGRSVGETNDDDSVIQLRTTVVTGLDDSRRVELEGGGAGVESDSKRLLHSLSLHVSHVGGDLAVGRDFTLGLVGIVIASTFASAVSREVRIVGIVHVTLVLVEVPRVVHPATLATPCTVVLAEVGFVLGVSGKSTIDDLLLRDAHRGGVLLLSEGTLESCVGGEGPARTTATLILNWGHEAVSEMIDTMGILNAESGTSTVVEAGGLGLSGSLVEVDQFTVLFGSQVTSPVHLHLESCRVRGASCAVDTIDLVGVVMVDLLSHDEVLDSLGVLVVLSVE